MAHINDDQEPRSDPAAPSSPEPPYGALFPNLDKVSPSTFRKGTLSRRRINIAVIVLVVIALVVVGLVIGADALFGPR